MTTTPEPAPPEPRDIALEMQTPEQAAELEEQSSSEGGAEGAEGRRPPGVPA